MNQNKSAAQVESSDSRRLFDLWRNGSGPTVDEMLAHASHLSARELTDLLLEDQYKRWLENTQPPIEDYVRRFPEVGADAELLTDLVFGEMCARQDTGEIIDLETFVIRFPDLSDALERRYQLDQMIHGTLSRDFGNYTLLRTLGRGGMAVVYSARDKELKRTVALKTIQPLFLAEEPARRRLQAEAEAVAALDHPNIVPIYGTGQVAGRHYIAMKLVDGGSLSSLIAELDDLREGVDCIRRLARALHHAHERGVIHRDIKPTNILIDRHGNPYIADFGLAKILDSEVSRAGHTRPGTVVGTLLYMSPEQAAAKKELTIHTDIYSLGTVLYEVLTGTTPFSVDAPDLQRQVMEREPASPRKLVPTLSKDLDVIVMKCLRKDSRERYSTAADLADDLDRSLSGEPVRARPIGSIARAGRWYKRNKAVATLATLLAALFLAVAAISPFVALHQAALRMESNARLAESKRATRVADANRLAVLAGSLADENPQLSLLIAAESIEVTSRSNEPPTAMAHLALRNSVARAGGLPVKVFNGDTEMESADLFNDLSMSKDGRWLAVASKDGNVYLCDVRDGALHSEPKVLSGDRPVQALAFSGDGAWLSAGYNGGAVHLWSLKDMSRESLIGHSADVRQLRFSPDSRWLFTAAENKLVRLQPVGGHGETRGQKERSVQCDYVHFAFSGDSQWLCLTVENDAAELWDLSELDSAQSLSGHKGKITALEFSGDSRWLVTGSEDKTARLYRLGQSDDLGDPEVLPEHAHAIEEVLFSPDNLWLVTVSSNRVISDEDGDARLWDMRAASPAACGRRLVDGLGGHEHNIFSATFSPDARWLATAGEDGSVRLWDLRSERPLERVIVLRGHNSYVTTVEFGPQNRRLFTGGFDHKGRLWDLASRDPGRDPLVLNVHEAPVVRGLFHPTGKLLVTATLSEESMRLWDLTRDDPASGSVVLDGTQDLNNPVAVSSDHTWLCFATGRDGTARLVDLLAERPQNNTFVLRGHRGQLKDIYFSADGTAVLTRSDHPTLQLFDLSERRAAAPAQLHHESRVDNAAISHDGDLIAAVEGANRLRVWRRIGSGLSHRSRQFKNPIRLLKFSPTRQWLVAGSGDWNTPTKLVLWRYTNAPEGTPVHAPTNEYVQEVRFSEDGRWLIGSTGPASTHKEAPTVNSVTLWNLDQPAREPVVIRDPSGASHYKSVSADGRWLITASADATIRLWDLRAPEPAAVVVGRHTSDPSNDSDPPRVNEAVMSKDGRWLAASTEQGNTVKVWSFSGSPRRDAIQPRGELTHSGVVTKLRLDPNGQWLAVGDGFVSVRLWRLDDSAVLDHSIELKIAPLSAMEWPELIDFSANGAWVFVVAEGVTRFWETDLRRLAKTARRRAGRQLSARERATWVHLSGHATVSAKKP